MFHSCSQELVNPSAVAQNATYTLNLITKYENQADGSVGNNISAVAFLIENINRFMHRNGITNMSIALKAE